MGEERWEGTGRHRRSGNCSPGVIYEIRIKEKISKIFLKRKLTSSISENTVTEPLRMWATKPVPSSSESSECGYPPAQTCSGLRQQERLENNSLSGVRPWTGMQAQTPQEVIHRIQGP